MKNKTFMEVLALYKNLATQDFYESENSFKDASARYSYRKIYVKKVLIITVLSFYVCFISRFITNLESSWLESLT